ncbi:MAG: hypothetical protein ACLR1R_01840 [Ruminococcus callidus]
MDKFENLQTSSENKQHYIPMEVTAETIKDFGINPADVVWTRIGNRKARVIMIPATEEQYKTFMRPLWREDKRQQRQEPAVSWTNFTRKPSMKSLIPTPTLKRML